jgi:hypothetical protein
LGYEGYERETVGLAYAARAVGGEVTATVEQSPENVPLEVRVLDRQGEVLHAVPVAITQLTRPIHDVNPSFLRDYQSARKVTQHSHFLTHILGPSTKPRWYSVAIRVTPHADSEAIPRCSGPGST